MPTLKIRTAVFWFLAPLLLISVLPAWGADQGKDEQTIEHATAVLQALLDSKVVPANLLVTANSSSFCPA